MIEKDVITDSCREIRDVTKDGDLIKLEATKIITEVNKSLPDDQ